MMLNIADEMERVTGALRIKPELHTRVLDICMVCYLSLLEYGTSDTDKI